MLYVFHLLFCNLYFFFENDLFIFFTHIYCSATVDISSLYITSSDTGLDNIVFIRLVVCFYVYCGFWYMNTLGLQSHLSSLVLIACAFGTVFQETKCMKILQIFFSRCYKISNYLKLNPI